MTPYEVAKAVQAMVFEALMVREGMIIDEHVAHERAANTAQALCGNFEVRELPDETTPHGYALAVPRPDADEDDPRIR